MTGPYDETKPGMSTGHTYNAKKQKCYSRIYVLFYWDIKHSSLYMEW